jgi:hypothetical protein
MVVAIQCTWIKKELINTNNLSKFELKMRTNNFTRFIRSGYAGVLNNFIESFITMQNHWTKCNNNFLQVLVLDNINFGYGRGLVNKFDEHYFQNVAGIDTYINMDKIATLCWKDLLNADNEFKNRTELGELLGLDVPVPESEYNKISSGYRSARKRYSVPGTRGSNLTQFLFTFTGLSKKLRSTITRTGAEPSKDYKKFMVSAGITITDDIDTGSIKEKVFKTK